jgi:hypothetical protein
MPVRSVMREAQSRWRYVMQHQQLLMLAGGIHMSDGRSENFARERYQSVNACSFLSNVDRSRLKHQNSAVCCWLLHNDIGFV